MVIPFNEIINDVKSDINNKSKFDDNDIKVVIDSIKLSNFTFRSVTGIAKQTKLQEDKISLILNYLKEKGYASKRTNNKGQEVWSIKNK